MQFNLHSSPVDLGDGTLVRQPPGTGQGYWAGAPGAYFDETDQAWYLTYRLRRPRGIPPDRGGEARIARSEDLATWRDVWSVNKSAYASASIERSCLVRGPDLDWHYFTSFVSPADGRWCVSTLRHGDVTRLDPKNGKILFTAPPLKLEGVKDPWILRHKGLYYMFLSVALPTDRTTTASHASLDIYNTGECISATGLAVSTDLEQWSWKGVVFAPDQPGWDQYCRRIGTVIAVDGKFYALYDGSAGHEENYEEKTGMAVSEDLIHWRSLTVRGPAFVGPGGSRSSRYADIQVRGSTAHVFYEQARVDGSHDLRMLTVDALFLRKLLTDAPGPA